MPSSLRRARPIACTVGALLLGCSASSPAPASAAAAATPFQTFADRYFSALYLTAPAQGTAAGLHQYDARLEELSAGASEALVRDCRYVVGIRLHTRNMSVEDGAKCFTEKAFQEPANAYEETRRGAYDPTYLYYTVGKLEIFKLREDYRRAKGSAYTLQGFHDAFVQQGPLPLKLMREVLLPGDRRPTL